MNKNYEFFNLQKNVEISLSKDFSVSQNYLNPFIPAAKIVFDLPYDCIVSVKLYDITGREIERTVLVKEFYFHKNFFRFKYYIYISSCPINLNNYVLGA